MARKESAATSKAKRKIFKVSDIVPADYNPRKIKDKAKKGLQVSVGKFGYLQDVVVNIRDGKNVIVGGHKRLEAMGLDPIGKIECTVVDLDEKDEKALNIALNSRHISGEFDEKLLEDLLSDISDHESFDDLNFDDLVLEFGFDKNPPSGKDDKLPAEPETVVIKLGDLIELGGHRVLCGSSTNAKDIQKLINGEKIDLVFSDPPYGADIVQSNSVGGAAPTKFGTVGAEKIVPAKTYMKIEGDETTDTAKAFYQTCLDLEFKNIVLWGGNYFTDFLYHSRCWIVWDKQMTGNLSEAEMAWTTFSKGGIRVFKYLWNGLSREGNRKDELKKRIHPTQKPVGLFVDIFERFDWFKTIFEGFGGSGSVLIACEKAKRTCFTMELEPFYVQIIVQRWCDYTESDEIKINGKEVSWKKYIGENNG